MNEPTTNATWIDSMSLGQAALWSVAGVAFAVVVVRVLCARVLPEPGPRPQRDLTAAGVITAIAFGFALLAAGLLTAALGSRGQNPDLPLRAFDLALPSLVNVIAAVIGLRFAQTRLATDAAAFGWRRVRPVDLAFALGVMCALAPAYVGLGALNAQLVDAFGMERHQRLVNALLAQGSLDPRIAVLIVAVVPPCEELMFRGVLQTAILSVTNRWIAIAGTALAFALVHDPQSWLLIGAVGVGLGIVRDRTGSVLASTFAHSAFNAFMLLQIAREAQSR